MSQLPLSFAVGLRDSGRALIEASAGTGKTYTIVNLAVRALLEPCLAAKPLTIEQLLLVTFTNNAALELQDRLRKRLVEVSKAIQSGDAQNDAALASFIERSRGAAMAEAQKRLRAALNDFDRATITTIHGYCQRIASELALETGTRFDIEFSEADAALDQYIDDFWRREIATAPSELVGLLSQDKLLKKTALKNLAAKARRSKDPLLCPETIVDVQLAAQKLQGQRQELKALWPEHAAPSWKLLTDALANGVLKANLYKAEKTAARWQALSQAVLAGLPFTGPLVSEAFAKFSQTALIDGTKKGKPPPEHALFKKIEAVAKIVSSLQAAPLFYARQFLRHLPASNQGATQPFDAMLRTAYDALHRVDAVATALAARLRRRYPLALIDEFQDTDPLQYAIFDRIYQSQAPEKCRLLMVGDPKQSIYAFRGADVFAYVRGSESASEKHQLLCNYRSDAPLVKAVNRLLQAPGLFALAGEGSTALGYPLVSAAAENAHIKLNAEQQAPLQFALPDNQTPAEQAADYVLWLLNGENKIVRNGAAQVIQASDIAILTGKNSDAILVQSELQRRGVAAALSSQLSVFSSSEANELALILAAVLEPNNSAYLRAALSTRLLGQNAAAIVALGQHNAASWDRWQERFTELRTLWQRQSLAIFAAALWRELVDVASLLGQIGGERVVTNLRHLLELLQEAANHEHMGCEACLAWLRKQIADSDNADSQLDNRQLRLDSDSACVQVLTAHKSKGLEYPIVLLPFVAEQRPAAKPPLTYHNADQQIVIDLDKGGQAQAEAEQAAENMRLLYVALTRAQHHVWLRLKEYPEKGPGKLDIGRMPAIYRALASLSGRDAAQVTASADDLVELVGNAIQQAPDLFGLATAKYASPLPATDVVEPPQLLAQVLPSQRLPRQTFGLRSFTGLVQRVSNAASEAPRMGGDEQSASIKVGGAAALPLLGFPAGAAAGTCLHTILEQLNFQQALEEQRHILRAAIRSSGLAEQASDSERLENIAAAGLAPVLSSKIYFATQQVSLAAVDNASRLNELKFHLPLASDDPDWPERLANLFANAKHPAVAAYAQQARQLNRETLTGFLTGVLDLAFSVNDNWALVDYKSNLLGANASDYTPTALARDMAENHYILQYHLYALALRRYLNLRLGNRFDWDRDFAGVAYLYLRGVGAGSEADQLGIYCDKPDNQRLNALEKILLGGQS